MSLAPCWGVLPCPSQVQVLDTQRALPSPRPSAGGQASPRAAEAPGASTEALPLWSHWGHGLHGPIPSWLGAVLSPAAHPSAAEGRGPGGPGAALGATPQRGAACPSHSAGRWTPSTEPVTRRPQPRPRWQRPGHRDGFQEPGQVPGARALATGPRGQVHTRWSKPPRWPSTLSSYE